MKLSVVASQEFVVPRDPGLMVEHYLGDLAISAGRLLKQLGVEGTAHLPVPEGFEDPLLAQIPRAGMQVSQPGGAAYWRVGAYLPDPHHREKGIIMDAAELAVGADYRLISVLGLRRDLWRSEVDATPAQRKLSPRQQQLTPFTKDMLEAFHRFEAQHHS